MGQITYADKAAINVNPDVADTNKVNAADMNEIKSAVNDNNTKIGNITGTILWTNPNPTSSFASQTITLSSDDYDLLEIYFKKSNNEIGMQSVKILKGYSCDLFYFDNYYGFTRKLAFNSNTTYQAKDGSLGQLANATSGTTDNSRCIPIYIIGYKTGLF